MKTCLVISFGPVPTPEHQKVEGGGMRAWGLAQGLRRNGVKVTVGVNNGFPQKLAEHEGVSIVSWGMDEKFIDLINSFDAVIISYCMGNEAVFVAENILPSVMLILDMYVPIYVEVSARDSKNIDAEYLSYQEEIKKYNRVLLRGDFFLCASEVQKIFYTGVLSTLGIINPLTYRQNRILVVLFGIHNIATDTTENPFLKLGIKKTDFVVMSFGGLYPWFRIEELLDTFLEFKDKEDIKFVVVGSRNPFNSNPDFIRQHEKAFQFSKENNLINKTVYFVDWVDFDERINWFKNATVVLSLNQPGEENIFSWRTRIMDFVWGELAILTNGGDTLSEQLIAMDAAIRLDDFSSSAIKILIQHLYDNPTVLDKIRNKIKEIKPKYFWENVTYPILQRILNEQLPWNDEHNYRLRLECPSTRKNKERRFIFISHPMDNTGAPLVLLEVIDEFAEKFGSKDILVIAPEVKENIRADLIKKNIIIENLVDEQHIKNQLDIREDDFVLLNTIAVSETYFNFILTQLETGKLKSACWFIHEDEQFIPYINPNFCDQGRVDRIKNLMSKGLLKVFVPSLRTKEQYSKIFNCTFMQVIPLRVSIPQALYVSREDADFNNIHFFMSGSSHDGRKGQLIILSALQNFLLRYYEKAPSQYRDFRLTLLSIGDDWISQQLKWIAESTLEGKVESYPAMQRDQALKIMSQCNAVICCSLCETFGLFVVEGMLMNQVVLRNNCAGVDEQLKNNVNGLLIEHSNINSISDKIEYLLNRNKISNKELREMGDASRKMAESYRNNSYLEKLLSDCFV